MLLEGDLTSIKQFFVENQLFITLTCPSQQLAMRARQHPFTFSFYILHFDLTIFFWLVRQLRYKRTKTWNSNWHKGKETA